MLTQSHKKLVVERVTPILFRDVASALTMAGVLDYTPALNANLNVDDTGNTFAGVLAGKFRVTLTHMLNVAASQYYVAGYKGTSPYDAGIFYCPYVPLQMVRSVGADSFRQKLDSKLVTESLQTHLLKSNTHHTVLSRNSNVYYRRVKVANLM